MSAALDWIMMATVLLLIMLGVRLMFFLLTQRGAEALEDSTIRLRKAFHMERPERPTARPIEVVATDVRRLGARFHGLPPTTPFAKFEGVRAAYDKALGECCTALGCTHLLDVIAPGPELDAERRRVESLLVRWGLTLSDAA